jgi:hypothetical protein
VARLTVALDQSFRAEPSDRPWTDRLVDLRVEDADHTLVEIDRLVRLHRAHERMSQGDEAAEPLYGRLYAAMGLTEVVTIKPS